MPAAGLHNGTSNRHASSVGAFAGLYWRLVNYEALNQYVLIAIALLAVLLYIGLICAGFAEFMRAIPKRSNRKKRSRNRRETRGLRNAKRSF
jgi:hypothetical protein